MIKNKVLYLICSGLIYSTSYCFAQEKLTDEIQQEIAQIAAGINKTQEAANRGFNELLKGKNKKNISLLVAIGNAYLNHNCLSEAQAYAYNAMKINSKSAPVYMLAGDIALAQKNVGMACGYYEQAILFDTNCYDAYLKYARAYLGVNPQLSIEMLTKLKANHPELSEVNRELGNAYYQAQNYSKAKSAYDEFMQQGTPNAQDYSRYAMLLYLNKDYIQSLSSVNKGLIIEKDNHLLKRLRMYDLYETGAYKEGLEAADVFFNGQEESDYVYLDFLYHGRLLQANGQNEEAVQWFEKAVKADTSHEHPEIIKEASAVYEKLQNYPEAIHLYLLYLDELNGKAEVSDRFLLGRLYYMAAGSNTANELEKKSYLKKADEIFAEISQRVPDNYLGYFWRARTNAMADSESTEGLAKPYYESALALLETKADASKSLIIECESYLGYYHFLKKDYEQSKIYWNKILQLDPENVIAKQALQGL